MNRPKIKPTTTTAAIEQRPPRDSSARQTTGLPCGELSEVGTRKEPYRGRDLGSCIPQQYDQLKEKVGWVDSPPDGGISHVVWWEGEDCHGIDVWESAEDWAAFGQSRTGPAAAELGFTMEATPVFHDAHEILIVKTHQQP